MKFLKIVFYLFVTNNISLNAQVLVHPPYPRDISKMATVDSGNVRVMYALNAVDIKNPDTYDDLQCLEIGSRLSKCYSYFVYHSDSLCTEWGKKHKGAHSAPIRCGDGGKQGGKWSEYYYTDFFKDTSKETLTQYTYMPHRIAHCQYTESIPAQDWVMHDDTATIAGYLCQKAVCFFRGRNFEAWFTADIPIGNGPWKFGGLPGLILKIYDADKLYIFECTKIEIHQQAYPIKMHGIEYFKTDRDKFRKLVKGINENYFKMTGWITSKPILQPPYHPLELE